MPANSAPHAAYFTDHGTLFHAIMAVYFSDHSTPSERSDAGLLVCLIGAGFGYGFLSSSHGISR